LRQRTSPSANQTSRHRTAASVPSGITVALNGQPSDVAHAGIASRLVTMWIPGSKFGRGGVVQYENASSSQVKFYDYRICILCYDWLGTPQDLNTVGKVNDLIATMYFKDA
jgi:hypothetical protein